MALVPERVLLNGWNLFKNGAQNIRSSYNSIKQISTEHERIHQGRSFRHSEVHSLAIAEVYAHLIIPNSGSDIHLQSMNIKADGGIVHLGLYENPFTDANSLGALDTDEWLNQNRRSLNTPPFVAYENPFTDANSLGVKVFEDLITDVSKDAGGTEEGIPNEVMLDNNKSYVLRVTNNSGGNIVTVDKFTVYDAKD